MVSRSDDAAGGTSDIVLTDYLSRIVRGWPVTVGCLVVFMAAAAAYTTTLPRIYQSRALVKVNTSAWSTLPDATLASKWIESKSGLLDWMSAADRRSTSYGAAPVSDRGGHMEVTARSVAPDKAAEAANRIADEYVRDANSTYVPQPLRSAPATPPAGLVTTARTLETKMSEPSYASRPADQRLADAATLNFIEVKLRSRQDLAAAAEQAKVEAAKERVLLAAVITRASPVPSPISPSLRLNLAVAAGLALLGSIAFLSLRPPRPRTD